jgi:hypothetical protein
MNATPGTDGSDLNTKLLRSQNQIFCSPKFLWIPGGSWIAVNSESYPGPTSGRAWVHYASRYCVWVPINTLNSGWCKVSGEVKLNYCKIKIRLFFARENSDRYPGRGSRVTLNSDSYPGPTSGRAWVHYAGGHCTLIMRTNLLRGRSLSG